MDDRNTSTVYEWDWEEIDEGGDISEHHHGDTIPERPDGPSELVLVRDVWLRADGDLMNRQHAYVEDGALPATFPNDKRVPKRFHAELAKYLKHGART